MDGSDNHQKPYYFLEPRVVPVTTPFINLDHGEESDDDVATRYQLYKTISDEILTKINQIIQTSNDDLFKYLYHFVKVDNPDPPITTSLIQPIRKLSVGYISLSSNAANNFRILDEFYKIVDNDHQIKIIKLSSKKGTYSIKSILREIILQVDEPGDDDVMEDDDEEEEKIIDDDIGNDGNMRYNLEILRNWYIANQFTRIILVFEDTDAIDHQVINLFLKFIYQINDLPLKIIFGLTASNISTWINKTINNEFKIKMVNYKFETKSNNDLCFSILNEIILHSPVMLDYTLVNIILSRFFNGNNSIDSLINELKLSLMIHFYQNDFSRLLIDDITLDDIDTLKKLPSYKQHAELMLFKYQNGDIGRSQVEQVFSNDYIVMKFNESKQLYNDFKTNFKAVIELLSTYQTIEPIKVYQLIISHNFFKSNFLKDLLGNIDGNNADEHKRIDDKTKLVKTLKQLIKLPTVFKEIYFINGGDYDKKLPYLMENYENLMINLVRPNSRKIIENNLKSSESYLDNSLIIKHSKFEPIMVKLFNLLNEAPTAINHFEFFNAFKQSLNKSDIIKEFNLQEMEDDEKWNKLILSWFLQICNEFLLIGLIKEKSRGDHFEKSIWRGL